MEQTYIRHVQLLGFEKRFFPSQHYVYMLMVKWSDLSEKLIYRTYPEIYTFHKSLKEMFPIEAGKIENRDRIIPSLPAPRWVDSQKSTETRQSTLAEYCHALINLPPHISRCTLLCSFFRVRAEDENPPAPNPIKRNETFVASRGNTSEISGPIILDSYRVIADYSKTSKHEIDLHTGDLVEIVEKNPNGWWFCQCEMKRGWVPASYLEPLDEPEEAEDAEPDYRGELYVTIRAYEAEQEDEMSLGLGETIEVIHKLLDGWWVIRRGEETGHFPSMYLQKANAREKSEAEKLNLQRHKPPPRRSTIRNVQSIHSRPRRRLSQDAYRRNSRRFMQQKSGSRLAEPHGTPRTAAKTTAKPTPKPALRERKNQGMKGTNPDPHAPQGNVPEPSGSGSEGELKKPAPVIPPRPSPELILERCTDNTRKRVSIHDRSRSGSSGSH